ncbi:hypothetical protein Ddye_027972 [Dipteronia dyeriana]|uniref:Uncharacterized protein n=1 Tax=Dipteronia dyeriana TaxID=168575 RepID=A0AAD9TQ54_9ROSI|nr:hypothetical protein Ddye_027972 [Dipteronia dyeriana]
MDQSKHYKMKKSLTSDDHHNELMNSQFMKRVITKLVLSVSVFSLLFSHHQTWFSLLHSLNFYLSTLPVKLVSHTLDKNYTFLLCNGLLVLLTKYSGLFSSSSSYSSSSSSSSSSSKHVNNNSLNELYYYKSFEVDSRVIEAELPLLKKEDHDHDHDEAQQNDQHEHIEEEVIIVAETTTDHHDQYHENSSMVQEDKLQEEEEQQQQEKQVFVEEEEQGGLSREDIEEKEEEEERGGNGELSTEELNKKFDDFIRKMKEELRIEAQRQLVLV